MTAHEYKIYCWIQGKVPDAKIIRNLLRQERRNKCSVKKK